MAARKKPALPPRHGARKPAPHAVPHPQPDHAPVTAAPALGAPPTVDRLQRILGNRAVGRLLRAPASARPLQRALALDTEPIASYGALSEEQQELLKQKCSKHIPIQADETIEAIIEEIIDGAENVDVSAEDLADLIIEIANHYFNAMAPEEIDTSTQAGRIAATMMQNDARITDISQQMGSPNLSNVGRGNALATATFMENNPQFMGYLGQQGIKTTFNAQKASGIGGMYENGSIYMDKLVGKESKDVFLRTVIHEMGHATFQQLLLQGNKLDDDVSKGEHGNLNTALGTNLVNQNLLEQNGGGGGGRRGGRIIHNMDQQLQQMEQMQQQEQHLQTEIAKFSQDGMAFYNAWLVLRQDDGRYMLGVDLGKVMTSEKRKPYQAERFEEFCAESFMHILKEEATLRQHILTLQNDQNVPGAVNQAWQQALTILVKYKPIIAG